MCLALPYRVETTDGATAVVARGGVRTTVTLLPVAERVVPGDYVLVHSGLVLARLADDDVNRLAELVGERGME
jgi:hydrogenase expression/formation protein HypC